MDYQELRNVLLRKGHAKEDTDRDHIFFYIEINGKLERATKISHGAKGQIDNDLLGRIARQMRLNVGELREFVQCTLERNDWVEKWKSRPGLWGR